MIRVALPSHWAEILDVYASARQFMKQAGNPTQWGDSYPPECMLEEDIRLGQLYVEEVDGRVQGVFALIPGEDPTYRVMEGQWLSDRPYAAVHRVASRGEIPGLTARILDFALARHGNVRIDTHADNRPMQNALARAGFTFCGHIQLEDGTSRMAYQREISTT